MGSETMPALRSICVFCGASAGRDPGYTAAAAAVGTELARRGIELVYGGGRLGRWASSPTRRSRPVVA